MALELYNDGHHIGILFQNLVTGEAIQANQALIDTIEESLAIADEGKRARAAATVELTQMETDLRKTLASASAPTR